MKTAIQIISRKSPKLSRRYQEPPRGSDLGEVRKYGTRRNSHDIGPLGFEIVSSRVRYDN